MDRQTVEHPTHGHTWAERKGFDLHRTPAIVQHAGPTFGQHLWEILTKHLGYDDDTASAWVATGSLTRKRQRAASGRRGRFVSVGRRW